MASLAGKRVIVTGGAGFIGSHLVGRLLAEGVSHVAVVDNFFLGKEENLNDARRLVGERLKIYREDAADGASMNAIFRAEHPDLVFNLATKALLYSFFNPAGAAKVNFDIALTLAELLRAGAFRRLIHLSSSEVYGTARFSPMTEQHPMLAETSYAAGKAAADLLLSSYVNMFGLEIVTVRPFNNYGPRQNDGALAAVVPMTIKRIASGQRPLIEGDGLQTRDFIYVDDTVSAILKLASEDSLKGKVINLGSGEETSILEIVRAISDIMGYAGPFDHTAPRPADVRRHCAGIEVAREIIGAVATTPLTDGLRRTVEWYRDRRQA